MSSDSLHKHHIIPLHEWKIRINPTATRRDKDFNSPDNVVYLTLDQHIECHKWLWENNASEKDRLAYLVLSGSIGIEQFRSEIVRLSWKTRPRKYPQEIRAKMGAKLGNQNAKGKRFTLEQRERVSASRMGKKRGPYKQEIKPRKPRILTEQHKDRIRESLLGKKRGPYKRSSN